MDTDEVKPSSVVVSAPPAQSQSRHLDEDDGYGLLAAIIIVGIFWILGAHLALYGLRNRRLSIFLSSLLLFSTLYFAQVSFGVVVAAIVLSFLLAFVPQLYKIGLVFVGIAGGSSAVAVVAVVALSVSLDDVDVNAVGITLVCVEAVAALGCGWGALKKGDSCFILATASTGGFLIDALEENSIGFADNTRGTWDDLQQLGQQRKALRLAGKTYPATPTQDALVRSIQAKVAPADLKSLLTEFVTKFANRYKTSAEGAQSAGWIFDKVTKLKPTNTNVKFTVTKFAHAWRQYSVVARIEPVVGSKKYNDTVILSAHQDSINPSNLKVAPGADDDGSGSISIYQTLNLLLTSNEWNPTRPVEVHWYAAEETGLEGSAAIVKSYAAQQTDIYAQVQQDMIGYYKPGSTPVVAFTLDFSYIPLVDFLKKLVTKYLSIGYVDRAIGYASSDHASWFRAGYPSSFPFEAARGNGNPYAHTSNDTLANINWGHVADFTKFSIAYVVELTQQTKAAC
ncbi:hypothetical protein B5M09_004433 [Aphanomyces astaci]|uniref:Peptidase M28 domain-containing protein n=1 Tax=Aphanomyces astaci TaxID=112090 RepID=A0A425DEM2_APHAT|nr:hypothetical protein B5M09_004433 [Aphanomyces astaci]